LRKTGLNGSHRPASASAPVALGDYAERGELPQMASGRARPGVAALAAFFVAYLSDGLGYSLILILVATGRELLGAGTLFGFPVIPAALYKAGYENVGLMLLPPGAFLLLGIIIWIQRTTSGTFEE